MFRILEVRRQWLHKNGIIDWLINLIIVLYILEMG